jgi:hypothetical protein
MENVIEGQKTTLLTTHRTEVDCDHEQEGKITSSVGVFLQLVRVFLLVLSCLDVLRVLGTHA